MFSGHRSEEQAAIMATAKAWQMARGTVARRCCSERGCAQRARQNDAVTCSISLNSANREGGIHGRQRSTIGLPNLGQQVLRVSGGASAWSWNRECARVDGRDCRGVRSQELFG